MSYFKIVQFGDFYRNRVPLPPPLGNSDANQPLQYSTFVPRRTGVEMPQGGRAALLPQNGIRSATRHILKRPRNAARPFSFLCRSPGGVTLEATDTVPTLPRVASAAWVGTDETPPPSPPPLE